MRGRRPAGVPVSALGEFAHNLHNAQGEGSQIAFFGAAPHLGTSGIAIKFARALAHEARVVLVGLGSGDAAIKQISGDPAAPGLAELADGDASIGDIITKDRMSGLNLIVSGRAPAAPGKILSAPGMSKNFKALAYTYGHVVIDAGVVDDADMASIAALASHAILLVETLSNRGTDKARERLEDAGFDNVTILVAGRPDRRRRCHGLRRQPSHRRRVTSSLTSPLRERSRAKLEAGDIIRAALAKAGKPIGPYDVLIAAQARRRGATLVTANRREFARVPGLKTKTGPPNLHPPPRSGEGDRQGPARRAGG